MLRDKMILKDNIVRKLGDFPDLEFLGQESENRRMNYKEFTFHRLGVRFHRLRTLLHPFSGVPKRDMRYLKEMVLSEFAPYFIAGNERVLIYGGVYGSTPEVIFVQQARLYTEETIIIPEAARKIIHPNQPNILDDIRKFPISVPIFKVKVKL